MLRGEYKTTKKKGYNKKKQRKNRVYHLFFRFLFRYLSNQCNIRKPN